MYVHGIENQKFFPRRSEECSNAKFIGKVEQLSILDERQILIECALYGYISWCNVETDDYTQILCNGNWRPETKSALQLPVTLTSCFYCFVRSAIHLS